ncbi:hypothetical protein BBP40_001388 [Aspergillus hancockii]|nr:hypothetical protein BBP40_001388 [Aspergillus hancockii]
MSAPALSSRSSSAQMDIPDGQNDAINAQGRLPVGTWNGRKMEVGGRRLAGYLLRMAFIQGRRQCLASGRLRPTTDIFPVGGMQMAVLTAAEEQYKIHPEPLSSRTSTPKSRKA